MGIDPDTIGPRISESVGAAAQLIATRAVVVGQNLLSVAAQTALMLYLLFFFLRDGDKLLATLNYAIPMGDGRQQTLFRRFAAVTRATLKGSLLVGLVQGALGGVLFWILGLRAPVFWGVIMAMLSLLPIVGPRIVWAPVALYLMFTGSMTKGIILVIGGVLVVGTADNILRPLLVGRETRMPDYMVLLSTLGGLSVFGPAGFVAGPVLAALFLSVWDMFAQEQRGVVLRQERRYASFRGNITMQGFAIFDTAIGRCAIAWGDGGVIGVKLPERSDAAMRARMARQHPEARETAPPQEIEAAIADIRRLLDGHKQDLSRIDLDMSAVPDFEQRVYVETRSIPPGETLTYGDIATRLGDVGLSRAVGQALGRNPFAIVVPCHRVLAAGGKSGGFSAVGGVETKRRLLEIEGARDLHPTLPWDPIR